MPVVTSRKGVRSEGPRDPSAGPRRTSFPSWDCSPSAVNPEHPDQVEASRPTEAPDRFYIGINVERRALEKVSEQIHRRPEKGGLSNVLFVHAPVEDLPAELDGAAGEIHIHFPWGSLLRAVAIGEE